MSYNTSYLGAVTRSFAVTIGCKQASLVRTRSSVGNSDFVVKAIGRSGICRVFVLHLCPIRCPRVCFFLAFVFHQSTKCHMAPSSGSFAQYTYITRNVPKVLLEDKSYSGHEKELDVDGGTEMFCFEGYIIVCLRVQP